MSAAGVRRWSVLFGLWWIQVAGVAYTIAPAGFLTIVMARLGVGATGANWLISAVYLGMFIAAIPVGVLLEHVSVRRGIVGGTLLLVVASLATWAAGTTFWLLLVSRFAAGVLVVAVWTVSVPTIGALFPKDLEASAVGIFSTAVLVGMGLGQVGGSALATGVAWNAPFAVFGLFALGGVAVFVVAVRGLEFQADTRENPTRAEIGDVLSRPSVWGVSMLAFLAFALNLLFTNWMPTYITSHFGVSLLAGGLLAAVFPVVGVLGRVSSGPISDQLFEGSRRTVVLGSFVLVTPIIAVFPVVDTIPVLVPALLVAGFVSQVGLALLYTYVRELVPSNVERTALAVLNAVGFFGAFAAPIVTGALVERAGSYQPLFPLGVGLGLLGVFVAWATPSVIES